MRQKLITLDDESFKLASKRANFSQWVRMALKATEQGGIELVNPMEMDANQALAIALAKMQRDYGFEHELVGDLLKIMASVRALSAVHDSDDE